MTYCRILFNVPMTLLTDGHSVCTPYSANEWCGIFGNGEVSRFGEMRTSAASCSRVVKTVASLLSV